MKFYNVSHLEIALQRWEELNLLMELVNDLCGKKITSKDCFKSTSCWREFRSFLLSGKNISWETFKEKFIFSEESFLGSKINGKRFWIDLPCAIKKWTEESRSVFFLEEDLQLSLMETSLENINWTDLRLPFNSFIVNLGVPMLIYENRKSSSIMVTLYQAMLDKNDVIEVRFFDDEQKLDLTPYEKEIIEEYLKNKNASKFSLLADKIKKAISNLEIDKSASTTALAVIPKIKETKISTSLVDLFRIFGTDETNRVEYKAECTEDEEKHISFFNNSLQIVLGLCLYLQTIPSSSKKHGSVGGDSLEWIDLPKKSKLGRNAITDISKVCSVGNAHLALLEKQAVLEIKKSHVNSSEKSPHFRRGTWCRKSGDGNDQNAPRVIWRRPTMVRSDKLQQNSLPIGQRVIVG